MSEPSAQSLQRRAALAARRSLTPEERLHLSEIIARRFFASRWFASAKHIGLYLPADDEVDTRSIIAQCWRARRAVFVPVIGPRSTMHFRRIEPDSTLVTNCFGLLEPKDGVVVPSVRLDVVITPTVAFDKHGQRIGMGGGYFDRSFAFLKHRRLYGKPKLVGVAFSCQEVNEIARNPWDVSLSAVITDTGTMTFAPTNAGVSDVSN